MVLRLIELLDLLLLLYGDLVLFFVKMILEQQKHAGQSSRQNHGTGGVEIGLARGIGQHELRVMERHIIAHQRLDGAQ